jgi:hypothetical protein
MNTYAYIENGQVTNVIVWDGKDDWTPPEGVTMVELPDDSSVGIGFTYDGATFTPPPPPAVPPHTAVETLAANTATRDALLAQATSAIAPLQDAVDLDIATDADTAALKAWKTYRVLVNRIDLTQASPVWPTAPGGVQ